MVASFFASPDMYLEGALVTAFLAAYFGGMLASFTPCVYPVIPITVAYLGVAGNTSRAKGFLVSTVYVLGMAVTYTFLGAFAALTGSLFGQIQSNPWMYMIIANICILMGLSMLGVFMVFGGSAGFLARFQFKGRKGGIPGAFLVGIVSGLIVGPCTTPVLAVLLSLIAAGQNVLLGMLLMLVFALGMGTLLVCIGTFARLLTAIPKSGVWMDRINTVFGIVMLGMGEYFLIKAGMLWI